MVELHFNIIVIVPAAPPPSFSIPYSASSSTLAFILSEICEIQIFYPTRCALLLVTPGHPPLYDNYVIGVCNRIHIKLSSSRFYGRMTMGRNSVEQLMGFPFKISLSFYYYVRARVLWLHVHTHSRPHPSIY